MERVEKRLELLGAPDPTSEPLDQGERSQLHDLTVQLAEPELSLEACLEIAAQMRFLLVGREMVSTETP